MPKKNWRNITDGHKERSWKDALRFLVEEYFERKSDDPESGKIAIEISKLFGTSERGLLASLRREIDFVADKRLETHWLTLPMTTDTTLAIGQRMVELKHSAALNPFLERAELLAKVPKDFELIVTQYHNLWRAGEREPGGFDYVLKVLRYLFLTYSETRDVERVVAQRALRYWSKEEILFPLITKLIENKSKKETRLAIAMCDKWWRLANQKPPASKPIVPRAIYDLLIRSDFYVAWHAAAERWAERCCAASTDGPAEASGEALQRMRRTLALDLLRREKLEGAKRLYHSGLIDPATAKPMLFMLYRYRLADFDAALEQVEGAEERKKGLVEIGDLLVKGEPEGEKKVDTLDGEAPIRSCEVKVDLVRAFDYYKKAHQAGAEGVVIKVADLLIKSNQAGVVAWLIEMGDDALFAALCRHYLGTKQAEAVRFWYDKLKEKPDSLTVALCQLFIQQDQNKTALALAEACSCNLVCEILASEGSVKELEKEELKAWEALKERKQPRVEPHSPVPPVPPEPPLPDANPTADSPESVAESRASTGGWREEAATRLAISRRAKLKYLLETFGGLPPRSRKRKRAIARAIGDIFYSSDEMSLVDGYMCVLAERFDKGFVRVDRALALKWYAVEDGFEAPLDKTGAPFQLGSDEGEEEHKAKAVKRYQMPRPKSEAKKVTFFGGKKWDPDGVYPPPQQLQEELRWIIHYSVTDQLNGSVPHRLNWN